MTRSATRKRTGDGEGAHGGRNVDDSGRGSRGGRGRGAANKVHTTIDDSCGEEEEETKQPGGYGTGDPLKFYPDRFHGCFSSKAVAEVVQTFGPEKTRILREIGLGGLLYLKVGMNHSRNLVFYLMKRFVPEKMKIILGSGHEIVLSEESFERVLGIRGSGIVLAEEDGTVSKEIRERLDSMFSTGNPGGLPTVSDVKAILLKDYGDKLSKEEEDVFVVAMAAFTCATFLSSAGRQAMVPKSIWKFISDPENVRQCNWANYGLKVIRDVGENLLKDVLIEPYAIVLKGCWLYLEVRTEK
jgi:hypothetical protein